MQTTLETAIKRERFERVSNPNQTSRTLAVLQLYGQGLYGKQIADRLKIKKSAVSYHTGILARMGLIEERVWSSFKSFAVTDAGRTAMESGRFDELPYTMAEQRLHGLQISVPVAVPDEMEGMWGPYSTGLKNQVQRFMAVHKLHVTLHEVKSKDHTTLNIKTNSDYPLAKSDITAANIVFDVYEFLLAHGYIIDRKRYRVTDLHGQDGESDSKELAHTYPHAEVLLDRNRAKLTPRDPDQPGRVWMDKTPTEGIESNCVSYLKKKVMVPEYVYEMRKDIRSLSEATERMASANLRMAENIAEFSGQSAIYGQHLNAHLPVLEGMQKLIKKIDHRLSQRRLSEFL